MGKKKEFREVEDSRLLIKKIHKILEGEKGVRYVKTIWEEAEGEVNLGSMANPNEKILAFKYFIPPKENKFNIFFGRIG